MKTKLHANRIAMRGGSYSALITAVVLGILIAANILVGQLPAAWTKIDISSTKLYSITSNTKAVVNALQKDVTIYWVVQADQEDSILQNLLARYESLSGHIEVVKKNPDVYPTFTQQYTREAVMNNSLVVTCGEKYRYIAYTDIYLTDLDMYSYSYTTSFDGEGAITSAIDYVVSEELPTVYVLQGHGEPDLPETFADQVTKANIQLEALSLLTADGIPESAAGLILYAPQSDISEQERDMLLEYSEAGGRLLVMAGPVEGDALENLYSVLEYYGVAAEEGLVVESDRNHYAFQYPYILIPELEQSPITESLISSKYSAVMPLARGLCQMYNGSSVTALLTTSGYSFSKTAGFALESYDMEEGDVYGPFTLAVSIDCGVDGRIVWFACSDFLDDMYNAYSSGANCDLAMNALSWLVGESEAMAIRSKSLNYNYLTISQSQASTLKMIMIGVIPGAYLLYGIFVLLDTRRKQNETL